MNKTELIAIIIGCCMSMWWFLYWIYTLVINIKSTLDYIQRWGKQKLLAIKILNNFLFCAPIIIPTITNWVILFWRPVIGFRIIATLTFLAIVPLTIFICFENEYFANWENFKQGFLWTNLILIVVPTFLMGLAYVLR